ncbi:MAG: MFS transporter [Planctomycetota bacterium]
MQTQDRSTRLWIYLFPAIMDMVVATIIFVNPLRAAKMGYDYSVLGGLGAVWGAVAIVANQAVGRIVRPDNAARVMLVGCGCMIAVCLLFLMTSDIVAMYVLVSLTGMATACFFAPFQVFMKAVGTGQRWTVANSASLYTFAWSMGFAAGPLIAGGLMELDDPFGGVEAGGGWRYCYLFSAACVALTAIGILRVRDRVGAGAEADDPPPTVSTEGADAARPGAEGAGTDGAGEVASPPGTPAAPLAPRAPDLAWLGWVCSGFGILVASAIQAVFPGRGEALGLAESAQGQVLFVLRFAQGMGALALFRSRTWMYRPGPVLAFAVVGVVGTLLFGLAESRAGFLIGAACYGTYAGAVFFYFVFHALVHPSRSARYVATNESVVGFVSVAGPFLAGMLADWRGFGFPFLISAVILAMVVLFQAGVHRRHPFPVSPGRTGDAAGCGPDAGTGA